MKKNSFLNIIEIFQSVQGETSFAGLPTTFIRLAACNLRCTWCDTTYSFGRGAPHSIEAISERVTAFGCRHVCITGGEPLLQSNVHDLILELCEKGYIISLETGGSLSTANVHPLVHVILDIKCPDSGMSEKNYWENLGYLQKGRDEVKFVINSRTDYEYAKDIASRYRLYENAKEVLFSPVHGVLDAKELIAWLLKDRLPVRLNVQIHKFIWSPNTKGV